MFIRNSILRNPEDGTPQGSGTAPAVAAPLPPVPADAPVPVDPLARERYEQMYGRPAPNPSAPATPVPPSTPVTQVTTPGVEEVIQPLKQTIDTLKAELENLRRQQNSQQQQPPPASPAVQQKWIDLIKEGKYDEADTLYRTQVATQVREEMLPDITDKVRSQIQFESQLEKINADFEAKNPDVIPFADAILYKADQILIGEQRNGLIQTREQFLERYKQVVSKQIEDTRNHIQRIRGEGATAAATTRTEVLASTTAPSASSRATIPGTPHTQSQPKTASEIIAERQAAQARIQGLGVQTSL